jgi:hypothetical protein
MTTYGAGYPHFPGRDGSVDAQVHAKVEALAPFFEHVHVGFGG